jgi:two-component system cell cycle sensor histidine kinase/response regulator CckA
MNIIRILYMEDDPGLARLLQKILQRRGFLVDVASNGEEGLAMAKASSYNLLLVDYNMPFQGGIDVIRTLSLAGSLPPTIMVTGEGNEAVAVEALKMGALDYIVKDVDMKYLDLLPSVIDQVLLRQQLIKERQHMIEVVKEGEDRYRQLFDSNPIPILVYDLQSLTFLAVNNAAVTHYGYSQDEFRKMTVNDIYTLEDIPELLSILSMLDQGAKQTGIWRHVLKNGSVIDVEITSHCINLDGKRAHFILANDVNDRKKSEENLLRAQKLESLAVLAGGLAHDFNNLMTAVIGNISLARLSTKPGDGLYESLEEAEKASSRAQTLTQQLLTFSRGGAPVKKPLSVKKMIEELSGFALRGSKSRCEFNIQNDLWPIEADEAQLGQVIHNMIMNADQAMPSGGIIKVTAANLTLPENNPLSLKRGDYIQISIADQGVGIPEDHYQKIFDPYFTTKQNGIGLGLATSYSVIKRHDGHIAIESAAGMGSTFHIYLPVCKHAACSKPAAGKTVVNGAGRILLMDDEEMIRDVASKMLNKLGYDVECTRDGDEAIRLYEQARNSDRPFSAVIMDLTIPGGMGGKETVQKLKEIDPAVKAIVSSGYSSDPIMANFKQYGFSGVVSKPYTIKTLSETVNAILSEKNV